MNSDKEFEIRVGIIMLLANFLKLDKNGVKKARQKCVTMQDLNINNPNVFAEFPYLSEIMATLNRPFAQVYYAQMAAAWTIAEAFVTFPYETMKIFTNTHLDNWTYNKAIQKICESRTPDEEVKAFLRGMKLPK